MKKIVSGVFFLTLVLLLFFRLQISLTRFFDVDEFSYLHWAADVARGQRPYADFFLFIPPGFFWVMAPVVRMFWGSTDVFLAGRMLSFVIFLGILGALGYLWRITRGRKYSLLPPIILAFLPLPYDKFFEIRPDNLSTFFALGGMLLAARAVWFWAGISYALSILILPKIVPMVFVVFCIALWKKQLVRFTSGFFLPILGFGLWALTLGDFSAVWYSLTKLPFEANQISRMYTMEPHLFFFPNSSFYGGPGITVGLIVNHAVWLLGISAGIIALLTRWTAVEFLVSGSFFALVYSYVEFFPLKHSQYLIPIAVFVSFYAAGALSRLKEPLLFFILALMVFVAWDVNKIKLTWTNTVQMNQMNQLISIIPKEAEVFDLEGRLVFWKNSYPICCLAMGSFYPFLSRPPRRLRDELEKRQTQYLFQGDSRRFTALPPQDLRYIETHYTPVSGWGEALWRRNE